MFDNLPQDVVASNSNKGQEFRTSSETACLRTPRLGRRAEQVSGGGGGWCCVSDSHPET